MALSFGKWVVASLVTMLAGQQLAQADSPYGDLRWRQLGPFRGGWATVVEGVPDKPDVFYFGAAGGGVWKTTDAGETWRAIFEHGSAAAIGALAIARSNPDVIYIGTGQPEPRYDVGAGLGVFKSVDGGAHWTSVGLDNTRYIGRIWVDPKNPDIVLVGAQGHFFGPSGDRGLYRSTNGGNTWTHVLAINDWTGVVDIASDPKDAKTIFASAWEAHQFPWLSYFMPAAGPGSALYKSTDGGATWTRLSGGGWPQTKLGRIGIAVSHTAKGTRVYAAIDSGEASGLFRSDDGGAHWARINDSHAFTDYYASRLTVAPNDPDVVYTVGQSIRRCTQGGKSCTIIRGAPGGDDYHHIWINPLHPDHIITGSDQGAVVSVNGGETWSSWYNQPTGQFYHLAADNRFPYWIYSGQQDSGTVAIASRSDYGELTYRDWHPVGGEERDYDIPDPQDPDIVYGSGLGGRVTKWDARTGQVQDVTPWPEDNYGKRPTLSKFHYMWTTPLIASNTGPASLYLGAQVLWRTRDQGRTWSIISGDLTGKSDDAKNCDGDVSLSDAKACGYGAIASIAPAPRHGDEVWVGTDDGLLQLTRDDGAHWTNVTPPIVPLWAKVQSIDVSTLEDGVAYVAVDAHRIDDYQPHVLRTRDYGQTWQEIDTGLPRDHFVSVVRADPVKQGLLYAGTDEGVFEWSGTLEKWEPLQKNLPTAWVTDLLVHGDDLIAATEGRGIWVLDDITPLRRNFVHSGDESAVTLYQPAAAVRVHPDNNEDTPLPPETPAGENPPAGAIIDYRIGAEVKGPVTLEFRDNGGKIMRRFSSDENLKPPKAELYFDKAWLKPPERLSGAPGMHRFVWDLRYERPDSVNYGYSIAAVWEHDTPLEPNGPFALPGKYTVVLQADRKEISAPLMISEDPRVSASLDDLAAELALSRKIDAAMEDATRVYREQAAFRHVLDARFPKDKTKRDPQMIAWIERLRAEPKAGAPSFAGAARKLAGIANALNSADAAPTPVQRRVVDDALAQFDAAKQDWDGAKSDALAPLNAALVRGGEKPVAVTAVDLEQVEEPDDGEDLP